MDACGAPGPPPLRPQVAAEAALPTAAPPAPPAPPPPWRGASPAYHPRSSSGDGGGGQQQQHAHPLPPSRLGSGVWRASTPGGGERGAPSPPPPLPPADDPVTQESVRAALATAASAGCADPSLASLADAADGAGGLRIAPPLGPPAFAQAAPLPRSPAPPVLPHLAHPDSVDAPPWLEWLAMADADENEPSTSTTPLPDLPLVVGARGAWLALPPTALVHWDRGGQFSPAGGTKAASYVALVPRGLEAEARAAALLGSISRTWAQSGLGAHTPGGAVPGAGPVGIITYDAAGGIPALARAYAALQLALSRSRPPLHWPGPGLEEEGGHGSPDGCLVIYLVPPSPGPATALAALVACARAPTAPPPPVGAGAAAAAPPPFRLARSSDGGSADLATTTLHRQSSDAGAGPARRGGTPDRYRSAARDTYRRESGGGGGSRAGSPGPGLVGPGRRTGSGSGEPDLGGPVAVPATLQLLPAGVDGEDLSGRTARAVAFATFNKLPAGSGDGGGGGDGGSLAHQPLAALADLGGQKGGVPCLHCAVAVIPPPPSSHRPSSEGGGGVGGRSTLLALAWTDGTGELAPGATVLRVAGGPDAVPGAVLGAAGSMLSRAACAATREGARPTRLLITRLGAPSPPEASAWAEAVHESAVPPTAVVALSADPPFRPATLGDARHGTPFLAVSSAAATNQACIVWPPSPQGGPEGDTLRAASVVGLAGLTAASPAALAAAAAELHGLGRLNAGMEAAVVGAGGWASPGAHLPVHAATALRLARLVAHAERAGLYCR